MTRAERVKQAQVLRDRGMTVMQIAERMGVTRSTAGAYLTDPDLAKQRARRERYRSRCVDCGVLTDGSGGYADQRKRCADCNRKRQHEEAFWTRETVIAAIRVWTEQSGGIPPVATDWNPTHARANGHLDKAQKFYEEDAWPYTGTVQNVFGSWNAAIRAAGLVPFDPSHYGRDGEDRALCQEIANRYAAGESSYRLAREYGCSDETIRYRIRCVGGVLRTHKEAMALRAAA